MSSCSRAATRTTSATQASARRDRACRRHRERRTRAGALALRNIHDRRPAGVPPAREPPGRDHPARRPRPSARREGLEVCRPQDARIRDAIAWTPPLTCSAAPPFRSRSSRRTSATRRRRHSAGRSRTATARHRLTGDETHERSTRERPKCRDVAPSSRGGAGEEPAAEIAWVVRTPPWQGQPSAAVAALLTLTGQLQDGEMRWRLIMTPSSDRRSTSGAIPRPSRGGTAGGRRRRAGRWRA